MKDYFLNYGLTKEEADILTEYCERSGNTKERALMFADEILADYMADMEIVRRFRDEEKWERVTLDDCIEHTEGSGYWKKDTVRNMLLAGNEVFTPHAVYKIADRDHYAII